MEAIEELEGGKDAFDPNLRVVYADDNASPHSSHAVTELMGSLGIQSVNWPPYSPDLNLIENCWALLKKRVYNNGSRTFQTEAEIEAVIEEEWWKLQEEDGYFERLYSAMPRRVAQVVAARGGNIRTN